MQVRSEAIDWVLPSPRQVRARCETALWWLGVPLALSAAVALLWTRWAWLAAAVLALWLVWILATARPHVRGLAWTATGDAFVARSGWWVRSVRSLPWSRVRSVELSEGIIDTRLGIASLVVKVPGLGIPVKGLAPDEAKALRDELLARSAPDKVRPGEARGTTPVSSEPVSSTPVAPDGSVVTDAAEPRHEPAPPPEPAEPAATPEAAEPDLDLPWFRAHPLSDVAESFSALLGLAGFGAYLALREAEDVGGVLDWATRTVTDPRWASLAVAVIGAIALWSEVSRRRTWWALDDDVLHQRSTGRARMRTSVRLDRIDGVDLASSVGARLFGLAQLTVLVADGDDPMTVGHQRREAAEAMRERLLSHGAAHVDEVTVGPAPDAGSGSARSTAEHHPAPDADRPAPGGARTSGEHHAAADDDRRPARVRLVRTDRRTVVRAFVLRDPVAAALVGSLVLAVVALTVPAAREGLFLAAGGIAFAGRRAWTQIDQGTGRTVERAGGDLHVASGLATRTEKTVRAGRVHAVRLGTRPQWWGADLWTVTVLTGSDDGSDDETDDDELSGALLPAADAATALTVAQEALPALARVDRRLLADLWPGARGVVHPDPTVDGAPVSVLRMPDRAWWLAPLTWRVRTAALAGDGLLVRTGRLAPRVTFVPLHRVQGIALEQGPLLRRARVVTVAVHLVDGPVKVDVGPLEATAARHLADELAVAARKDLRIRTMSDAGGTLCA